MIPIPIPVLIVSCGHLSSGIAHRVALVGAREHKSANLRKCLATLYCRRGFLSWALQALFGYLMTFICLESFFDTFSSYFDLMCLSFATTNDLSHMMMIWLHLSRVHLFKQLPFVRTIIWWIWLNHELQTLITVDSCVLSFWWRFSWSFSWNLLALVMCDNDIVVGGNVLVKLAILLETHCDDIW